MNYSVLKEKMDAFFSNASPEDVVRQLEQLGYEFEECTEGIEFGMGKSNPLYSHCEPFTPVGGRIKSACKFSSLDEMLSLAA